MGGLQLMEMSAKSRDFTVMNRLVTILERDKEAAPFKLEEIYSVLFEGVPRWELSSPAEWTVPELGRALEFVEEIVVRYTALFEDPRSFPVTYAKKQKRSAIFLDEQLGKVLREVAVRSGALEWMTGEERSAKDAFLDEPILFLKQEARKKGFPRTKKGGAVSLGILRERYREKQASRGVRLPKESPWVQPGP